MTRKLLLLFGGALVFWLLIGLPAHAFGGGYPALIFSGAAVLLCLPPMAATLVWVAWAQTKSVQDQLVAMAGGTGLRMFFVLGGGMVLFLAVPYFRGQVVFWIWVLVAYLATLGLDVVLMTAGRKTADG